MINTNFYKPIHFCIQELVSPDVYLEHGDKYYELFDWRILYTADCLREYFGIPLVINDWHRGGVRRLSGFRSSDCYIGVKLSQHKLGNALDIISPKMEASEMRLKIIEKHRLFPYITAMEDKVPWLHIDCRSTEEKLLLFKRG